MVTDCVFCEIAAERAPATVVCEWPDALAIRPRNPVVPDHVLVLPRAHVASAAADPVVTGATMARAALWASWQGPCNLITSVGAEATQTVMHLHIHVVPRRAGDGLALPWTNRGAA
jgi:histidine triad (HIT) family protein